MKVKLTKLSEAKNPLYKAADWKDWKYGQDNPGVSIPVEYELEGELLENLKVGDRIKINRTKRNGVDMPGYFVSSVIKLIARYDGYDLIETQNSLYKMTQIYEKK